MKLSWPDKADGRRKPFKPANIQSQSDMANSGTRRSKPSPVYLINTSIDDIQLSGCYLRPQMSHRARFNPILPMIDLGSSMARLDGGEAKLLLYCKSVLNKF
jgi:hypothetical protein